jgi:hypothetical protein
VIEEPFAKSGRGEGEEIKVHVTDTISNLRLKRRRSFSSSRGVFGTKFTLVTKSILASSQIFCNRPISSRVTFGGRGMPTSRYPSS